MAVWCAAAATAPAPAAAQLRPLEPADWTAFAEDATATVAVGSAVYERQRASLAGTVGRLIELGNVHAALRLGRRVVIEAGGTVRRVFDDGEAFAEPAGGAEKVRDGMRSDVGSFRIGTLVGLTGASDRPAVLLRFGSRLPTTDNRVGLDRDRTDFYATLAMRLERAGIRLTLEAGVGIHGTRDDGYEQSDVLLHAVRLVRAGGTVRPSLTFVGQLDGRSGPSVRGNEDLRELRVGLRLGRGVWLRTELVRGWTETSPDIGLRIGAGMRLPRPAR